MINPGYFYYQWLVSHVFSGILISVSWFFAFAIHFLLVNSFFSELFHAVSGNVFQYLFVLKCLNFVFTPEQ